MALLNRSPEDTRSRPHPPRPPGPIQTDRRLSNPLRRSKSAIIDRPHQHPDDKSIPFDPIGRLLQTRRGDRQDRQGRRGLDPPRCYGREVRSQHNVRTSCDQSRQRILGQILRCAPHDRRPRQIRRRLRRRGVRRHHRPLRSRRGHPCRGAENKGKRPEGRDLRQPRDPRREARAVPRSSRPRSHHDRPPRIRRTVLHLRLRPQDLLRLGMGGSSRKRTRNLRRRRHQRRHRPHLRRSRRQRPRGRLLPLQEDRHGPDHRRMAEARTQQGVPRWE